MKVKSILILCLSIFCCTSCTDYSYENTNITKTHSYSTTYNYETEMCVFESWDDYFQKVEMLNTASLEDLISYRNSYDFDMPGLDAEIYYRKNLLDICEDSAQYVNIDSLISSSNGLIYIENRTNNNLLQITQPNAKVQKYIQPTFYDMPDRLVLNGNRMFKVGNYISICLTNDNRTNNNNDLWRWDKLQTLIEKYIFEEDRDFFTNLEYQSVYDSKYGTNPGLNPNVQCDTEMLASTENRHYFASETGDYKMEVIIGTRTNIFNRRINECEVINWEYDKRSKTYRRDRAETTANIEFTSTEPCDECTKSFSWDNHFWYKDRTKRQSYKLCEDRSECQRPRITQYYINIYNENGCKIITNWTFN